MLSLLNKTFVRNVSKVAAGTASAQVIIIAFSPIITRLYGPEALGVYGAAIAGTAIITVIGSLTYENAIALPEEDGDAKSIIALSFILSLALSLFLAIILLLFKEPIISLFRLERISPYILMIPILFFFSSCQKIAMQWMIRTGKFGKTAKAAVAKALIVNSFKSGAGLFHPAASTLIGVETLGQALHTLMLSWKTKKEHEIKNKKMNRDLFRPACGKLIETARQYRDFPLYRAPQALINGFTKQLPVLIFASLFGPAYAGFYTIGQKVIKNPSGIVSASVGKVFYPRIIKAYHQKENMRSLLIKAVAGIACVGILPYSIILFFAPSLFSFVFGEAWTAAGQYASWLAVWLFFDFIKAPVIRTIPVIKIQGFFLVYSIIASLVRMAALILVAAFMKDDLLTVACFSVVNAFFSALLIFIVILKCGNNMDDKRLRQST